MFRRLHEFAVRQSLYPLILASLVAVTLFAGRVYVSGGYGFIFLVWNLILAWLPFVGSLWADWVHQRYPNRWWLLIIPGAFWLGFFPNAPYIITDLGHLAERLPVPLWYDVGMVSVFALTGLFLGIHSLRIMHRLVRSHVGPLLGWLFVMAVLPLAGFGVYLGRFLRWNSWDLLLRPKNVLSDVALRLMNPWDHPRTMGVSLLFAAILLISYLSISSREPAG